MFATLRSRLLLSYLAVLGTVLLIVGLALLAVSLTADARILPTLRQLNAISQSTRRELAPIVLQETGQPELQHFLDVTAATHEVRIVILDRQSDRLLYDSQPGSAAWTVASLSSVSRPRGEFAAVDAGLPVGRYRAPDGSRWMVLGQPLAGRGAGRFLVLFARPEPTFLQVFRETFVRPLFLAGCVAMLLSLLLAVLISRSVARPLQQMAGAAESIAQGDYDQQLPLSGPQEVRRVAGSFNAMAAQVAATQQAQRDFVTNVSHDLKTPLTAIRGWSQALLDGTAGQPEQQQRAAAIIQDEAERMARMVDQLLDLARIESGQLRLAREAVDLQHLVSDVHRNLSLRAEGQNVQFTLDAQPVPPVTGDRDRLTQVLTNLVDNALAHTPAGGRVHLSLRLYGEKAVEFVVQDTGQGIPAEDLSRVFERFYQVDKARVRSDGRRGSGLGLAIAKELVEAHGGRITAHSQVGQGSAFVVRLPTGSPEGSTVTRRGR